MSDLGPRPYLSYALPDRDVAWELSGALRRRGLDPWMDMAEMRPGRPIREEVTRGISESTSVVVLGTDKPPSASQHHEWWLATERGLSIVPVVTDLAVALPEPLRRFHPLVWQTDDVEALADALWRRDRPP